MKKVVLLASCMLCFTASFAQFPVVNKNVIDTNYVANISARNVISSDVVYTALANGLILHLNSTSLNDPNWEDLSHSGNDGTATNLIFSSSLLSNIVGKDNLSKLVVDTVFNSDSIYSVLIKIDNYQSTSVIDAFMGGLSDKFFAFKRPTYYLAFREDDNDYHGFDGSSNTSFVPYILLENGQYNIAIRSDGTDIYLNINGIDKGYITPTSTDFFLTKFFEGYSTDDYSPKMGIKEVRCYSRFLTSSEVAYWNTGYIAPYVESSVKNLPDTVYAAIGNPIQLNYSNFEKLSDYNLTWGIGATAGTDSINRFVVNESTIHDFGLNLYGKQGDQNVDTTTTIISVIDTLGADYDYDTLRVVMIGNSILGRSSNLIETTLEGLLNQNDDVVPLIYTDGNSGWTVAEWDNRDSDSPLFTGDFDLAGYLNSEFSIDSVNIFLISLGVNDIMDDIPVAAATVVQHFQNIVDSVLVEKPGIKIIINVPTVGSDDASDYTSPIFYSFYEYNHFNLVNTLIDSFANVANVYIAVGGMSVDRNTQYFDDVHPLNSGLINIAYNIYPLIRNFINSGYGVNLLNDPSFENCPTCIADNGISDVFGQWGVATTSGLVELTNTYHKIAHGVKITNNTGGATLYVQISPSVTAGIQYNFSLWTKGDGANAGFFRVYDLTHSADIRTKITTGVTANSWTRVSYNFTAPVGCTSIRLYLYGSTINGSVIYFDTATLRKIT